MSWHLFLTAIFTVIINHGQTFGKELSLPMEKMSEISIPDNVIQVSGIDDALNMHDSQVENEHFRYVRAVDGNTGRKQMLEKTLPLEIFQRIMAALKLVNMNMTEDLVKRFVCRINVTKLSDINENVLKDAINLMDKDINTCPLNETIVLIEQIIKMVIQGKIPAKNNLIDFFTSNIFKLFAEIFDISDSEMAKIAVGVSVIDKNRLIHWTMADFGERFLCHLTVTNFTKIDNQVLLDTLLNFMTKSECSKDLLMRKWSKLATSFTNTIKEFLLPRVEMIGNEINNLTVAVMKEMKMIKWTEIRRNIFEVINQIDDIVNKTITNVKKSSDKDWTLQGLLKNFVCGLNITDFYKVDKNFPEKILDTIGNLDVCTKKQQEAAWEKYLHATAMIYSVELNKALNELNMIIGNVSVSDILTYVTDEQIKFIKGVFRSVKVDTLIGIIWDNLKNNSDQMLSVKYIQRFMACNLKTSQITNMDTYKLMNIVAKFGQSLTCPISNYNDWQVDFIKLLLKFQYDMNFQQLYQLDKYIGDFNTKDLKHIAEYIESLKTLAMDSLYKIRDRSDEWISYIRQNDSVFNISTIVRHLVCFIAKGNFSSVNTTIISVGEFGKCTESESMRLTETLLNSLDKLNDGKIIKEFLIGFGILSGEFKIKKMKDLVTNLIERLNNYLLKIWDFIPRQIKHLTIAKIDEIIMCAVKAITQPIFGQPNAPNFRTCFYKITIISPDKPNKIPGRELKDRYKVGDDFPFEKMLAKKDNPEMLLQSLLTFTREPYTEKEERIIRFVTNKVINYLLTNQDKVIKDVNDNKKRILELASNVNQVDRIIPMIKLDSETLSVVKNIRSPQKSQKLLRKALKDMEIETKSVDEKKDFIRKISNDILMKSGTFVNKLYSDANKNVLIQIFKKKKESTSEEMTYDDDDEEEEEEESLAKLSLVNKLMNTTSKNETMALMMDTSLVSVISINMLQKVPPEEMCSMKADTTELKTDQIQYLVNSCPKSVANNAKTNANKLGKIATKLTKKIVNSLTLNELISVTSVACRYKKILDIDLEKMLKEHYIATKLDPMKNATSMFCVLKHVQTKLPWQQSQAIQICKILGNSMMKKIPPKQAKSFKNKCMVLLKNRNITFADMGSMNAFLEVADIQNLDPEIILQGAVVLGRYIWKPSVFNEIGKKLSDITSFKRHSSLTTDQVAQANIFIAAWSDADQIPKENVFQAHYSIAVTVRLLQNKKIKCLIEIQDNKECNAMDTIIKRVVQILVSAEAATNNRRKRSITASCHCSNIASLGMAAVQMSANQMSEMICASNFDECIEELSQITDWNQEHRQVFVKMALEIWGQPTNWNSSIMAIASAVIPGLSKDQIKMLTLDSIDTTFYLGKQNNWEAEKLTEIFMLFLKKLKNNNISSITSFDLQALGNIACGISPGNIQQIPTLSYINAASQIGNLKICSQSQLTAWSKKAMDIYGTDVNTWGLAEIASIGSVINGFSTADLQKLNERQIAAISLKIIPMILPQKLASLHPIQIGYLTTSQVQMVTLAQKKEMTEEQMNELNKKVLGAVTTDQNNNNNNNNNGGQKIKSSYFKLSMLLLISGNFNLFIWFSN
ncbi:unnamed protein product [Acanthosepion pharaonis]|uniref:Uncharacterized protein n=1 Tax=Acanthosepion pharaonis TaxID=158019 RepID=A0A812BDT5_ACAPH|nr:unnamed protein product [Sepia pharaonis]